MSARPFPRHAASLVTETHATSGSYAWNNSTIVPIISMNNIWRVYNCNTPIISNFISDDPEIMKTHLSIFIKIWGYWTHLARKPTVWTAKPSINNSLALPARATTTSTRSAASESYHHQLNQNDYHIANLCKISNLADFSATGPDYWHVRVSQPNLTNPVSLHI